MERFLKEYAVHYNLDYNCVMRRYNNLTKNNGRPVLNSIIDTKIKMGRDLYKQDMYILVNILAYNYDVNINYVNYDEFILSVDKILTKHNMLNLSLKIIGNLHDHDYCILMAYHIGTFLEDDPGDIKIALKD